MAQQGLFTKCSTVPIITNSHMAEIFRRKKPMKKFLCVLLSLVMLLSLAACGGKTEAPAAADGVGNDGDASNDPAVTLA